MKAVLLSLIIILNGMLLISPASLWAVQPPPQYTVTIGSVFQIDAVTPFHAKPAVVVNYIDSKGKAKTGACKVLNSADDFVTGATTLSCLWTKAVPPGIWSLSVQPKGGAMTLVSSSFIVAKPVITGVPPGAGGDQITITGRLFGTKASVYVMGPGMKKPSKCKSLTKHPMDQGSGESMMTVVLDKAVLAGDLCTLFVKNKTGEGRFLFNKSYCTVDVSGGPDAASYPVTFTNVMPVLNDEYKTTKIVLCTITSGSFTMGSPTNELGRWSTETQHKVTLSSNFYMGIYEITQAQYSNVMGVNPSYFTQGAHAPKRPVEKVSWNSIRGGTWPGEVPSNTTFMGILRTKTGRLFDLPTEAQWEYACRAGTTKALNNNTDLVSINQDPNMDILGRYWYNGGSNYTIDVVNGGTATVGSYLVNQWGLYDMHGNVWEWCLDWYQSDLGTGNVTDPPGAGSGSGRLVRGGSWLFGADICRSAGRGSGAPGFAGADYIGFRLSLGQ